MSRKDLSQFQNLSREGLIDLILQQQAENEELRARLAVLEEAKRLANARKYAPSSEQIPSLFDEAEVTEAFAEPEPETVEVKAHTRVRKPRQCAQAPADTPVYTIDHTEGAPDFIEKDGIRHTRTEDKVIDKIARIPARIIIERNIYPQYRADCDGAGNVVSFANRETDALSCSASLVAGIAVAKYDDHLPLYRQSEMFGRDGVSIGRQAMARWLILWYGQLLHLEQHFTKTMYRQKFLNMDETPLRVLDFRTENGRISGNSFMFIRSGSTFDATTRKTRRLVSCSYIQSRSRESLLEDYDRYGCSSYVMTDGLKSYDRYPRHCNCWVHAVRKFKQVLKDHPEPNAEKVVRLFDRLYVTEDKYRKQLLEGTVDADGFLRLRKEECMPVISEIISFVEGLRGKYPSGQMDKGITYILERKDSLARYLDVLEATPDNNASERIAKAFATGRKNWLFSQTVDGADASCFYYSCVENAKANGLDPAEYLELLLTFGPSARTEAELDALLPWNADTGRLSGIRNARMAAKADPDRTEPYHFTGLCR